MYVEEGPFRQFLIEAGLISRSALDSVVRDAAGRPLARVLIERGILGEDEARRAVAHTLGVPFVPLSREDIMQEAMVLIPEPLAREHNLMAYRLDDRTLEVALLDFADLEHLEFLRSNYRVLPRLTNRESLTRGLMRYQHHLRDTYGKALERHDSPNLLDTLLLHALQSRASDIHLQSDERGLLVRYRISGALKDAMTLPSAAGGAIIAKLRSLAGLSSSALPQQGRMRVDLGSGEDAIVRISSIPLIAGEKLVLTIVREKARRGFTLESLGFHGEALERLHNCLLRRRGLILVAGKNGTGKTTTLYTLLDLLNTPEVAIATIEQSVEHVLPRAAQSEVGQGGMTSASALRAALKTDPDVVMLGALADRETAALALEAASRGVLVLVAVEASGAREAAQVYADFGVSPERLANTLAASIGVGTVRKLGGKQFSDQHKINRADADVLEESANFGHVLAALKEEGKIDKDTPWKDLQFSKPVGSSEHPDGYHGLIGLQEVVVDAELIGLNLMEDGLFKAAQGLTSLEELKKLAK